MTRYFTEHIQIITSDQLELPGLLFTPTKVTDKAAIYLHGNGDSSVFYSVKRMQAIAQALTDKGIAFLAFNNRGAHFIKILNHHEEESARFITTSGSKGRRQQETVQGSAYELIRECEYDINGGVNLLAEKGYKYLYLIGHSTGANKICVYNHYQPNSPFRKFVLLSGGDDTGLLRKTMGDKFFYTALECAKKEVNRGRGLELVPRSIYSGIMSFQSFYDMANPDGEYNTFPFLEYLQHFKLSAKPLFRYFQAIARPMLVVYGENDEFVPDFKGSLAIQILQEQLTLNQSCHFEIISGADHGFHNHEEEMASVLADWLIQE
ncbi:MAG TPA: DUF1749 domain-containing protein [Candidatus Woesebacteria bacterium]|nr:DUF1749 domain-containing protein [Candidatus Woesebacteria bacterium]